MKNLQKIASTPTFLAAAAFCLLSLVGLTRVFEQWPPQAVGGLIVLGTVSFLLLHRFSISFREVIDWTSNERLMCWHAVRAPVGVAFLVMSSEGLLPELFAHRAGWGDLFVAFSGMAIVVAGLSQDPSRWKTATYIAWNVIGLIDLMLAVGTGIYLATMQVDSMVWIVRLPLLMVPTFIIPVLLATHFIMLGRLFAAMRVWPANAINRPEHGAR